jgi:hypothetical protein
VGDPRSKGAKLGKPGVGAVGAVGAVWRRVRAYGRTESVYLAVVACIWYGSFGSTPRRCVLVREANSTKAYDLALFTFDAEASPAKVVARYAVRWSIEPSNATGQHRPPATGRRASRMARDRGVPWPGPLRSWRAGVNTRLGRPSRRRSDPVIGRGVAGETREVRQYVGVASQRVGDDGGCGSGA